METGLVSIITPAYNCAELLQETVRSVQAQSYPHWELLIIDDCSTDETPLQIRALAEKEKRIRPFFLDENSGTAAARNLGLENARGEYIAFLDSDDLWEPEKLARQLSFMKENGYPFSCTHYRQIDAAGKPNGRIIKCRPRADYHRVLLDCPVGNSTVIFSRKALGEFRVPEIRKRNDYALWLKMLRATPYIYGLGEVLASYRLSSNSISRNKWKLIRHQWYVYRNLEHLNLFRSAFHIFWWGVIKIFRLK